MEKQKVIIAMKGHPGSGKSTLAQSIASALRVPLLDKDDVRDCTASLQHQSSLLNDLSYAVLWPTSTASATWRPPTTPASWEDLEKLLEGYGGCTDYDVGDVARDHVELGDVVSNVVEFVVCQCCY